jgi:tellurite resistance protein
MTMNAARVPLNFFGMPFGLAGLGVTWLTMAGYGRVPPAVGDIVLASAAVAWLIVLAGYLRYVLSVRPALVSDLLDPVAVPFASLALITPMLLAADGLYPHAPAAGRVLFDVFLVLTVLLGGWFTGQWIYRPVSLDTCHPGYFLPTVAGGLIASAGAPPRGGHAGARRDLLARSGLDHPGAAAARLRAAAVHAQHVGVHVQPGGGGHHRDVLAQ